MSGLLRIGCLGWYMISVANPIQLLLFGLVVVGVGWLFWRTLD